MRFTMISAASTLVLLLSGCDANPSSPTLVETAFRADDLRPFLTEELQALLAPDGTFPVTALEAVDRTVLTPSEAKELALAFARTFGPHFRKVLEREHGRPIDFGTLTATTRVIVAESPYERLPLGTYLPLQKRAGPYYLVTLQHAGVNAISIAVSALATDVSIMDGKPVFPPHYGNEFKFRGFPVEGALRSHVQPEQAVQIAARHTGARAKATPTFLSRGFRWTPEIGAWRVELDRPARLVSRSGKPVTTSIVYVGFDGSVTPSPEEPVHPVHVQLSEQTGGSSVQLLPRQH